MSPSTGHSLLPLPPPLLLLLCILPLLRLLFNFIWLSFKRKSACNSIFHAPPGCVCTQGVTAGLAGSRGAGGLPFGQEGIKTMKDGLQQNMRQRHIWHAISTTTNGKGKAHPILLMSCEAIPLPFTHPSLSPPLTSYPLTVKR